MATEQAFDIEISDADVAQCRTVGDLYRCILNLTAARSGREDRSSLLDPDNTWNRLVAIIVEHSGLRPERVLPGAEWGRDLGID